ncbi:MAG TPA: SIMPL domain-containing protein [Candidatus Elarobacter sp.]|jgi:hypothetical protein|nr:SIMPL domain-containing protein [Candidatus Elarobacter sp.]
MLAATGQSPAPSTTPAPVPASPSCARPNVAAHVLRTVSPDTPAFAAQQGISGTVQVIVSLDQLSRVIGTRIQSSPSAVLNSAALAAARASTYQTEIRQCQPIAADYIFSVEFDAQPTATIVAGKPVLVISTVATVMQPPDSATVTVVLRGPAVGDASAAQAPADAVTALRAKLAALGIRASEITEAGSLAATPVSRAMPTPHPFGTTPAPATPAPGPMFAVYRNIRIGVASMQTLPAVLAAVRDAPGTVGGGVQYALRDREPAYREAVVRAVRDARTRADVAARAAGVRLGAVQRLSIEPNEVDAGPSSPWTTTVSGFAEGTPAPAIAVRARVTATYLIAR